MEGTQRMLEAVYTIEKRWSEVGKTVRTAPSRLLGQHVDVVKSEQEPIAVDDTQASKDL